jgi:hypothetical protein
VKLGSLKVLTAKTLKENTQRKHSKKKLKGNKNAAIGGMRRNKVSTDLG